MESQSDSPRSMSRRKALAGSLAVGGATWITPSIVGLDRVAAAVGSCGTAPLQVDWTAHAGTFPTSITANDGTGIMISTFNPNLVADLGFFGLAYNGTLNGRDNPLLIAMDNASNGDNATIRFDFTQPVQVCFNLVDVDRAGGNWEDTIEIRGTNGPTAVNLGPADFVTGAANGYLTTNTVRGVSPTTTATGNIEVSFPSAITRLEVEHRDDSASTAFQFIGIHDFFWC